MGRSAYTPTTQRTLVKLAQVSATQAHSAKPDETLVLPGHASISMSTMTEAAPSTSPSSSRKDVLPWRHQAFDPDDETLPIVTERFVETDPQIMLEIEEEETIEEFLTNDTDATHNSHRVGTSAPGHHSDGDDMQHSNGGYYDGAARAHTTIVTAEEAFSPSAAVFHQHTLPLQLPAPGEMHRRHNTAAARQATHNTNSTASTPFMF